MYMMFQVRSAEDASAVLSHFKRFHDAFIESMLVKVTPDGTEGFGFAIPVHYNVTLSFVHSNYPTAQVDDRRGQRIEMRLAGVRRMSIGDMVAADDMLQECLIGVDANGSIHLDVGGDGLVTFVCDALTVEELNDRSHERRT